MFEYNLQNQPPRPNWPDLNRPPLDPTTPAVDGRSLLSKTDFGEMTAGLFFQNPSDTTQPNYKWVKRIFKTHSQTSDSILLLSLSPLTVPLLFVNLYSSLISTRHRSLLFVCNVTSSSLPRSPPSLRFDLSILNHSISLLFGRNITRSSLSLIHLHR